MQIIEIIKNADIALIEGDSKLGKLTFALYAFSQNSEIKKVTILSAIQKKLMEKRINSIKNITDQDLNRIFNNLEIFCLKENWLEIKASYGFDFIYEDIERIIENSECDAMILHRPDLIFSEGEFDLARLFLEKFIEIANARNKKIFITSESGHFITYFLENYTDISLFIKKKNHHREIIIKHSLYPIKSNIYEFILVDNKFILSAKTQKPQNIFNKNKMLIISKDERFKNLHNYIFGEYFDIDYASDLSEVIQKIKNQPEIIIYLDNEKTPNFNICSTIKKTSSKSNIIYILNKEYIRTEDKMDAIQSQCFETFCKNFNLEEYILTIEKLKDNFFYSNKLKLLPPQKIATGYENFCKAVKSLYNEKIFFSLVNTSEIKKEISEKLRNHDIIYKKDSVYICLINVTKEMFDKHLKEKLQLKNYKFTECIEWDEKC